MKDDSKIIDTDLKWALDRDALAEEILDEQKTLQAEKDAEQKYRDNYSKNSDGNINALGHQNTNRGSNRNTNDAAALSANKISTGFGLSTVYNNVSFASGGLTGFSALGNEFTTATVEVSADTASRVASTVQDTTQDMEGIADQDFVAYVLKPEILDEKEEQAKAGFTSEAREQFTNATLEQEGIVRLPDGSVAISEEKLETLRAQFTQAENGTELNTPNSEATTTVTTYTLTGKVSDDFAPATNGVDAPSTEFDLTFGLDNNNDAPDIQIPMRAPEIDAPA